LKWNEKEVDFLKKNYQILSREELCERFNRTWGAIMKKAYYLGIQREKINDSNPFDINSINNHVFLDDEDG